jgi:hypothetical protein
VRLGVPMSNRPVLPHRAPHDAGLPPPKPASSQLGSEADQPRNRVLSKWIMRGGEALIRIRMSALEARRAGLRPRWDGSENGPSSSSSMRTSAPFLPKPPRPTPRMLAQVTFPGLNTPFRPALLMALEGNDRGRRSQTKRAAQAAGVCAQALSQGRGLEYESPSATG